MDTTRGRILPFPDLDAAPPAPEELLAMIGELPPDGQTAVRAAIHIAAFCQSLSGDQRQQLVHLLNVFVDVPPHLQLEVLAILEQLSARTDAGW